MSLGNNPLLAVYVHNIVRGQFPDVCKAECGEAGKDEKVTSESERCIGKLMFRLAVRISPSVRYSLFLYVGSNTELRKRVSRYQTVVMRP